MIDDATLRQPSPIVPHPDRPGFTLACRNCGLVAQGLWAELERGLTDAAWFCGAPDCQAAYTRRAELASGTP
jgi:hypothetical protein